eukprot:2129219-Amphidinium_carterae.2
MRVMRMISGCSRMLQCGAVYLSLARSHFCSHCMLVGASLAIGQLPRVVYHAKAMDQMIMQSNITE